MFYDVLMEKRAKKARKDDEHLRERQHPSGTRAALALAGGMTLPLLGDAVGIGAGKGLLESTQKHDASGARELIKKLDPSKITPMLSSGVLNVINDPNTPKDMRDKLKRIFSIKTDERGKLVSMAGNMYIPAKGAPGIIHVPDLGPKIHGGEHLSPTTILHELGHATGAGNRSERFQDLVALSRKHRLGASALSSITGMAGALGARTDKELEYANNVNNVAGGISGIAQLPLLAEEARANIRAIGLGKKFDVPVRKRELAAAMSTYLGSAAGQTLLPWYVNRKIIQHRRNRKENQA
jgi:hypothetical protein